MSFVAVVVFPGNNCEVETKRALELQGMDARIVRWNDRECLKGANAVVIPGGFSFEDRGRSGVIASKEPIIEDIRKMAQRGCPILGICNGAQILVESGLIMENPEGSVALSLARNERRDESGHLMGTGFYHAHTYCKPLRKTPFSNFSQSIYIPLAHGEGRFMIPAQYQEEIKDQIVFQYVDKDGNADSHFPVNPNGSFENAAAISNKSGNVVAMMPHPERVDAGQVVFASLEQYLSTFEPQDIGVKNYNIDAPVLNQSELSDDIEFFVSLKITDNTQKTFERVLLEKGHLDVSLSRSVRWGVSFEDSISLDEKKSRALKMITSLELLNPHKESVVVKIEGLFFLYSEGDFTPISPDEDLISLYVVDKNDVKGEAKKDHLNHLLTDFSISSMSKMEVWGTKKESHFDDLSLFANPVSQVIYR